MDKTVVALETCCMLAVYEKHMRYCLGKFMKIIAIPISKHVSHSNSGKDFNACASSVLLYESEA